jgi:pectin methylesterase-like acyl-CoA thioesterase
MHLLPKSIGYLGLLWAVTSGAWACTAESTNASGTGGGGAVAPGSGGSSSSSPDAGVSGGQPGSSGGNGPAITGGATSSGGTSSASGGSLTGGIGTGGAPAQGGRSGGTTSASGGTASGGKSASGGAATGGASGGATAGGTQSGGTASGGLASGGAATGGARTGGAPSGGTRTGGAPSGGSPTGGAPSGGSPTGGTTATGGSTSSPCAGATQTLTVAADGSGQYTTVQSAINAIPSNNSKLIQVSVKAGTYHEQVTISKPFVCLTGASATTTTITNAAGTNIVTGGTVMVSGSDFSAANIAFENTGGDGSGQAVAFMANGLRQQFRDCRFLSYQDTLYTNTGTQYFRNCYIQGDTDYIFGDATAVFENCTMNNVAEGTAVTAPRTPQGTTYGFVFLGGSLTANPTTSTVRSNHVYLGRPWGPYAAAAFLNVAMGAHINADGWTTMSSNTLVNTRFWEYKSTGAGANPTNATRASRQLSDAQAANYTVKNVLNPWVPGYSQ